jgi:uncharacterized Zn-binding protein involved in type VI secretion
MQAAARVGDAISHGGAIVSGSGNVTVNNQAAAMVDASAVVCAQHASAVVSSGSASVTINNQAAARIGDETGCGATVTSGSDNVFIG